MIGKKRNVGVSTYGCLFPNQKGQITIFIIIGILMLVAFGGIIYFTQTASKEVIETEAISTATSVPVKFQSLQVYTENCLSQVAKRGLLVLGQQGGYIYPEVLGEFSSTDPTGSEGLSLDPMKVPYWHYNQEADTSNKVVYASHKPELYAKDDSHMSVESQLGRFVQEKISECLNDYAPFREQGYSIKVSDEGVSSSARIGENGVNFLYSMKVDASFEDSQSVLEQFNVYIPISLKHYYDVASSIAEAEQSHGFLERQGMELLSIYSRVDMNYFPPTSDVTYDPFAFYSWSESQLQSKYQEVLTSYVPMLRYLGSSNFYRATFPEGEVLAQKVADNMILTLFGADDISVNFDYLGWQPYFKTNSEDGKITPEVVHINPFNLGVADFTQQRYETHYDISYPVLVTLHDDYAFGGEGYTFMFGMESNIRNNAPAVPDKEIEVYPRKITSLACNEEQKSTELLKTVVVDSFSKEPIEMVKIGFSIPEVSNCEMGITDNDGELESKYPAVYGGVVSYMKEDYLTDFYPINTYEYKDKPGIIGYAVSGLSKEVIGSDRVIELHKIKSINVSVKKKELKECIVPLSCKYTDIVVYSDIECKKAKQQCFFNKGSNLLNSDKPVYSLEVNGSRSKYHDFYFINTEKSLSNSEEAVFTLERVSGLNNNVKGADFSASFSVTGKEVASVNLVPGVYKLTANLINKQELVIPKEKRCTYFDILLWGTQECFDINETKLDKYMSGGVQFNTPETYITITPEDLYTAKEITFYVVAQDIESTPQYINVTDNDGDKVQVNGRIVESLQVISNVGNISKNVKVENNLKPTFK